MELKSREDLKSRIETLFLDYKNKNPLMDSYPDNKEPSKSFVPENLTWVIDLFEERFQFIGSTPTFGEFAHLRNISFFDFMRLVKPCFIKNHIDLIEIIIAFSSSGSHTVRKDIRFEVLLPMRLSNNRYYYVKQTIIPKISNNQLHALQFVNIPVKFYDRECYKLEVFTKGELNGNLTSLIADKMEIPKIFTDDQICAVRLIGKGLTSNEIADMQFKTRAAVYKLNRKILENISEYFEMRFSNVYEAVRFYSDCFKSEWIRRT